MNSLTKPVALVMLTVLGLSACGGDATAGKVKENLKAAILGDSPPRNAANQVTQDQASCMADKIVDRLGVKKLQDDGVVDKDLTVFRDNTSDGSTAFFSTARTMSKPEATTMADAIFSCIPAGTFQKLMLNDVGAGGTPAEKECLTKAITDEVLKKALIEISAGNRDAMRTAVMGPATSCMFVRGPQTPH